MATQTQRTEVLQLYTAYFNRAADTIGVTYWTNEMDTNGWSIDNVADTFSQQSEYTTLYSGLSNTQIVEQVYTNVLNRTAEAAGATYWEGELANGNIGVTQLVQAVVAAATADNATATDKILFNNKIELSQYYYENNNSKTDISLSNITQNGSSIYSEKIKESNENLFEETGVITQIHDGDTISVLLNTSGEEVRVRLIGIQAMEIHPFTNNTPNDFYADEAIARLTELLGGVGETVTLRAIDQNIEILDRTARHVFSETSGEEVNVSEVLLEEGFVLPFSHETENTYNEFYMALAQEAKAEDIGIWSGDYDTPADSNNVNFDLLVNFDAEGDDVLNLSGEWIKITNTSGRDVDISGWVIRDSGLNFFIFPDATTIDNGDAITIYGGSGTNTNNIFYWGNTEPFLDNFGDGIYLHDYLDDSANPNDDIYPVGNIIASTLFPSLDNATDPLEGKVTINANYDAEGDDNINLNGEWVIIENISSSTINLKDYQIHSEPLGSDHYYFADTTLLQEGEVLTLYIGSGTDTSLEKYWGKDTGILANSSDRVWIDSLEGTLVAEDSWLL